MQDASNHEVLVYCPKCSVQNPLDKSLLGTSVICIKCGHTFVAKKNKTESPSKSVWKKGLYTLGVIFLAVLLKDLIVTTVHDNFTPKGKAEKDNALIMDKGKAEKDNALIMEYMNEYGARLRQYGQAVRSTLDIYCSQTGDELWGKKDPKKYRRAIEQSLEEAKSLHMWCEQKLKTFNPQMLTKEGETLKNMVREAYTSYYKLTTIGIELFSKTLECHQIHCGMKSDASSKDRDAYRAFLKKHPSIKEMSEILTKMDEEVMQIAKKYSSFEGEKIAKMESYRNLLNKTSNQ